MRVTPSRVILIIVIFVLLIVIYAYRNADSVNRMCVKHLESFGWNVLKGGSHEHAYLESSWPSEEIYNMKRLASKEIGLDPNKFLNNDINVYMYVLEEMGLNDNLRADIWVYEKKIIGAYVYHVENNHIMKFWPLNTPLEEVVSDIRGLSIFPK